MITSMTSSSSIWHAVHKTVVLDIIHQHLLLDPCQFSYDDELLAISMSLMSTLLNDDDRLIQLQASSLLCLIIKVS